MTNKDDNSLKVYKSNKLIEARYKLTAMEQKLVLYAASQVDSFYGENFTLLKIRVSEFFNIAGLDPKSKNQKFIKKVAEGLMDKTLTIENKNGNWLMMNWLASCEYIANEGIIELEFSQKMKPYLLNLKDTYFTRYELREVMQLSSQYSIRLYELLIRWVNTRHKSFTISVEELRKKMGLDDNEYSRFDSFEDRVIKTAVTEINNESNVTVTYKKIKLGRSINEIAFKFVMKNTEEMENICVLEKLQEAGLCKHIEEIRKHFNDADLPFSDIELDKAYQLVFNKLIGVKSIEDNLQEAIYNYLLYYYEYTKEQAGKYAYNYFMKCLEDDYANLRPILKYSGDPNEIKYKHKNSEEKIDD